MLICSNIKSRRLKTGVPSECMCNDPAKFTFLLDHFIDGPKGDKSYEENPLILPPPSGHPIPPGLPPTGSPKAMRFKDNNAVMLSLVSIIQGMIANDTPRAQYVFLSCSF